jgi:hypothetical protein
MWPRLVYLPCALDMQATSIMQLAGTDEAEILGICC